MYRFGEFALDPGRRTLFRADSPIALTPKAFDVLFFLLQNPNRLVRKEELLQAVWGDTFVEDGNLTQYISHVRKALGDNEDSRLIVTIARKGYQFAGEVVVSQSGPVFQNEQKVHVAEQADVAPTSEFPRMETVPSIWKSGRTIAIAALSLSLLPVVGYFSWRHFRPAADPRTGRVMLAVLPFENLTGDPNKEYLADGLTEQLISWLGRLNPEQLGVIARTSVMGYKHKDERPDQIGHDLSVQYVLENSLREGGGRIRLTSQLIQVRDQSHLWSQDYDYPAKDILDVEDNVAKAVAGEIQLRLTSQQESKVSQPHLVNPEAFDAYLRGYYFFEHSAADKDTEMAEIYFEKAIQLDPNYALAWVGLSRVRNWEGNVGLIPMQKGHQLAREAVQRALALDPNLPEANSQLGRIREYDDFDWAEAETSFRKAMALAPEDPTYINQEAEWSAKLGHFDEALNLARKALDLDPLNAASWTSLGEIRVMAGQLDEGEADFKKALELNPDFWSGPIWLSLIDLMKGQPQNALKEAERIQDAAQRLATTAIAYNALVHRKESDAALRELIAKFSATAPTDIAEVYAGRNQRDEAFEWLDRAYAQHDNGVAEITLNPLLSRLRGDPRFDALLKKLNLPD